MVNAEIGWGAGDGRVDGMPTVTTATTGKTITLRDGRTLGYAEYGDPTGAPVFFCHGTPGSRLDRHPDESIARSVGVRLIVADRPGYGLSTFQPGRRILDWPDDLTQLAETLGIGHFAVMGASGGGPHALACGYRLPQRVTRLALLASVAPFDIPNATEGMAAINRRSFMVARRAPFWLLHAISGWQARVLKRNPAALLDVLESQLPEADRAVLAIPAFRQELLASVAEAFRQGGRGHAWEERLFARPWGFRALDVRVQVYLWQGETDTLVPPSMGRYLAAAIPECVPTFLSDEGHLSIAYKCWRDALAAMVAEG
jgi:pimeloyl-ACP methyl ester carboxylesterase